MANRPAAEAELVPASEPVEATYVHDFYSWALEQARLVHEGRWETIDRANLAEEIGSLGREQFDKLESALRVLLMHMLKWDHQAERRGRTWLLSIKAQRVRVERVLQTNPGLKPRVPEAVTHGYRLARIEAAQKTGLEEEKFPQRCPYTWDDIVGRDFSL